MLPKTLGRALLSLALLVLGLTLPVAAAMPADAVITPGTNPSLTIGIVGYGKVESCATDTYQDGSTTLCTVTLTAAAVDAAGWAFDHWSGDCSGTSSTCKVTTDEEDCDTSGIKPVCTSVPEDAKPIAVFRDTRTPIAQITGGPEDQSTNWSDTGSVTFTFASNEPGEIARSECADESGNGWTSCTSAFTRNSLADGLHDFCVRQLDASGLVSNPVCHAWEQEASPTASVAASPSGNITDSGTTVTFTFSSNKVNHPTDGSTLQYRCVLDGDTFTSCPSTVTVSGLANGPHTMRVIARFTSKYGDIRDSTAASYSWDQADATAPRLTFGTRSGQVATTTPDLTYSIDDAHATVSCSVDGTTADCDQQHATLPTTNGVHLFHITVTDPIGNTGDYKWSWERENAPVTTIESGPAQGSATSGNTASFAFASSLANSTFACNVDGRGWAPCSDPHGAESLTGLTAGAHSLAVRATYHSPLGSALDGPVVTRNWSAIAPRCTVRLAPRLRSRHARVTVNCTASGRVRIAATVRVGSRTRSLARGTVSVTAGHARTITLRIPKATWKHLRHGHRYKAKVTARLGGAPTSYTSVEVRR